MAFVRLHQKKKPVYLAVDTIKKLEQDPNKGTLIWTDTDGCDCLVDEPLEAVVALLAVALK